MIKISKKKVVVASFECGGPTRISSLFMINALQLLEQGIVFEVNSEKLVKRGQLFISISGQLNHADVFKI